MTTGTTERTATDSIAQTTDVQYFSRPIECQFEDTTVLLLGTGNQPGPPVSRNQAVDAVQEKMYNN